MSSTDSLSIFGQEISDKKNKTKFFLNKLNHRRNLSTSTSFHHHNNSSKKIIPKEEVKKKQHERSTSFIISSNPNSLEQISSYQTNEKPKINKEKKESKKNINISKDCDYENNEKKKKTKNKQKMKFPKTPTKKDIKASEQKIEKDDDDEIREIIVRTNYGNSTNSPENYIILPKKLNDELEKPELNLINPNKNVEGNYSSYINGVVNSLKEFIEFDYDSIFDQENKDNVKYFRI